MSKRRKGKKPNIPQATLARARQQAGIEPEAEAAEAVEDVKETAKKATANASKPSGGRRRKAVTTAQLENRRKKGELTNQMIEDALTNPTKMVSEAELHQDYRHVLVDLRNMGVLAGILMVLLVALAQFI